MADHRLSNEEVVRLGEKIYDGKIKSNIDTQLHGKFLAIDVRTGDYQLGDRIHAALQAAKSKFGDNQFYVKRIGFSAAARIGCAYRRGRE